MRHDAVVARKLNPPMGAYFISVGKKVGCYHSKRWSIPTDALMVAESVTQRVTRLCALLNVFWQRLPQRRLL